MKLLSNTKENYRFYEIDLLRFLAALFVVFFHYGFRGYAADNMSKLTFEIFSPFARYGYLGFHLFFIISGFVILLTAYNKSASDFLISRMVRLYPAYWFSVTFTFLATLLIGKQRYHIEFIEYLSNLTMLHDYFGIKSVDGVYWTLMVELKFYFLIFSLILLNEIKRIKVYLSLWLALTIILTIYDIKYIESFLFPEWSSYFIAGACFYLLYKEGSNPYCLILIGLTYALSIYKSTKSIPALEAHYSSELNSAIIVTLISLFYFTFFMISTNNTKIINKPIYLAFGALTYPLYLIHQNVGYMLFNYLNGYLNKYIIFLFVFVGMLIVAYFIHTRIERKYSKRLKNILKPFVYRFSFLSTNN